MRKISPLTYLEEEAPPLQLGPVCRLSMQYHFQKVQPLLNIISRKSNHYLILFPGNPTITKYHFQKVQPLLNNISIHYFTLFLSGTKHISSLLAIEVSLGGLVYVLNNLPFFYCVCDNIGAAQINSNMKMYWHFDSNHEAELAYLYAELARTVTNGLHSGRTKVGQN